MAIAAVEVQVLFSAPQKIHCSLCRSIGRHSSLVYTTSMHVGIFAGTFDPVHEGHEAFAYEAIQVRNIDRLWLIPEANPRAKSDVTTLEHREEMLTRVFDSNSVCRVKVLKSPHAQFPECFTELAIEGSADILIGSDVAMRLGHWQNIDELLESAHFVVGVRGDSDSERVRSHMASLGLSQEDYTLILAPFSHHRSSVVRSGLQPTHTKTTSYARKHHLYTV